MSDKDGIKLAKIMGWTTVSCDHLWVSPDINQMSPQIDPPDPFTNANDDYAVLEWVRELHEKKPYDDVAEDILMLMNWLAKY